MLRSVLRSESFSLIMRAHHPQDHQQCRANTRTRNIELGTHWPNVFTKPADCAALNLFGIANLYSAFCFNRS